MLHQRFKQDDFVTMNVISTTVCLELLYQLTMNVISMTLCLELIYQLAMNVILMTKGSELLYSKLVTVITRSSIQCDQIKNIQTKSLRGFKSG